MTQEGFYGNEKDIEFGTEDFFAAITLPYSEQEAKTQSISPDQKRRAYAPRGRVYAQYMADQSNFVLLSGPAGTGKSRCNIEKVHAILDNVPGTRALILRKTRASLTESGLVTYENHVLPSGHPCLTEVKRNNRSQYNYPNGSILVVGGLDNPQRIMSTEYDIILILELLECEISDVEMVMSRLRNGVLPYQQLIADTNPDSKEHWIYKMWEKGKLKKYETHHEDNPVLWADNQKGTDIAYDGRKGNWTPVGGKYLKILDNLTGARKQRLRYGLWTASEGAIYGDVWNSERNLCNKFEIPREWRRVWAMDFGFNDPYVLLCGAIDPEGRIWIYREIYHTQRLIAEQARLAVYLAGWEYNSQGGMNGLRKIRDDAEPLPSAIVCDWDAEGRATFEAETGLKTETAYKSILDGIDAVSSRLLPREDNVAGLIFMKDITHKFDERLVQMMAPLNTVAEFYAYVWDITRQDYIKDKPADKYNHGMDCIRYLVAHVDGLREKFKSGDVSRILTENIINSVVFGTPFKREKYDDSGHRIKRHNYAAREISGRQTRTNKRRRSEAENRT